MEPDEEVGSPIIARIVPFMDVGDLRNVCV